MAAIGFVLLWQTSNTINFAQGEFVVLPAFAMVLFFVILRFPFVAAMLASVLGINVGRLVTITFMLNAALTALAAILIAPVYLVKYDIGVGLGLKAFYAAIIGGFNQIRGALLGGLLVGVVETLSAAYISSHFRDAFALVILIAVLLLKPEGIWGVKEEWAS